LAKPRDYQHNDSGNHIAKIWGDHAFHFMNLLRLGEYAAKETADMSILLFAARSAARCVGTHYPPRYESDSR
jgi:hypothetical protein